MILMDLPPPALTPPALVQAFDSMGSAVVSVVRTVPVYRSSLVSSLFCSPADLPANVDPVSPANALDVGMQMAALAHELLPQASGMKPSGRRLRDMAVLARNAHLLQR